MPVELRPWSLLDADALVSASSGSPDLYKQLGGATLRTRGEAEEFIGAHLLPGDGRHDFAFSVDGVAVGNVGINRLDEVHQTAWTYYWLAAGHRGRGWAARGLAALSTWALTERGLFRLELGHRVNNPASCRVATSAGFRPEGLQRAKLRYGSERFDVETHARLATDPVPSVEPLPWATRAPGVRW
ncbi:GNAT family N-acetyltransferase [Cellulomonas bogoriensis]|uniref:GCN5 family acetyltransferase n=1 Tax=Cellulomonas bogoriensis 69B4 = DSM 16987 TaxID=1386082 RepID=A0A0A0BLT1_9CELL|nr:GNAT family protein [Cellulomonas bogoriensis]KGM08810.1 GCN5 family acetyltransferase [Cellulomonas bogoriensis 69B4 = DSM 16987]